MTTEQKKKLLADVRSAAHALGRIVDGGHDFSAFGTTNTERLRNDCIAVLAGLGLLEAVLGE